MSDEPSSPVHLGEVGTLANDLETRLDADPVVLHNLQVTGNLTDEQNNAYVKSTGTEGSVELENLTVTSNISGNLIVADTIRDTEGNDYVRSTESGGEVTLETLRVTASIESERIVSDRVETSTGQTFLSLERNETGTGRVDPFTVPFAGETFQNMVVDGNFVQMNGTMRGDAKYLTSFAERENENLEKRLSEFAKFSDRRIFVSATDGNDSNHGRSWDQAVKTVRRACELAQPRTTIFVASGDYYEITPIYVRSNVAIIGDSLRTVFLYSKSWEFKEQDPNGKGERAVDVNGIDYNRRDFFHVSSGVYLYGLRFKHLESPGYCASFPAAMVDVGVDSLGRMAPLLNGVVRPDQSQVPVLYSPEGYFKDNLPQTGTYPIGWDTSDNHVVVPIPPGAKIRTPYLDVANRLETKKEAFQNAVVNESFVNGLTDVQKETCRRDTGYLIDAMRYDFELGKYMHTYEAAFRYYYKDGREIPNAQLQPTVDAIAFLKETVREDLDDQNLLEPGVKTKLEALFFMLTETLQNPSFETTLDSFTQVTIDRIHVVSPGERYTLNARIDIDPPSREGGTRAFAVPEILDDTGGIQRVRVFQKGSGYVDEYRNPQWGKSIVRINDGGGAQNAELRPVFRIETFRAWSEEAGVMRPAGGVFSPQQDGPYRSQRTYKSFNGRFDARQIYPEDEEPCLVLECGIKLRQGAFGETALNNRGNFRRASQRMKEFRSAIQNAGIQRPEVPSGDTELRSLCFRDIGFLVDAIASDLFEGGAYESIRAANAYFTRDADGNTNSVLTNNSVDDQVRKTADVVRWIKDYVINTTFDDWSLEPDAIPIVESLFDGIADTIHKGEGTNLQEPDQIELNARRYVAYRLHDSNLTKWRFEGRNVRDKGWTILDQRDFTFEQREFANRTVTPSFDSNIENPGEWEVAYDILRENRASIQQAVIESVRVSSNITLTEQQYNTCFRDVGLILNAIMTDLRAGGTRFSKRAAIAYYVGNRSVLPVNQTQPTIDAIQMIKTAVLELLPIDRFENEREIVVSLIDGIIATIDAPRISVEGRYGIPNSNAYHFYRLVMVQNEEDRVEDQGAMRVGRVELFEEDIPTVYVDGPEITGTVVEGVEVVNGGSQYSTSSPPTVLFVRGPNDPAGAPNAEAEAIVEDGKVVRVRMIKGGANFLSPPTVRFETSTGEGATAVAFMGDDYARVRVDSLDPESGRIDQVSVVHTGSGYEVTPTVSIPPPRRFQPFVVASPYVQNCSNISGPWDTKRYRVSEFYPLPFPLDNIYRDASQTDVRRVNNYGSAGGIRIDGAACSSESPLRSFVVDAFTQVNQGGLGFLLTNLAYAQFVSTFGTFCTTHMKAINGSFANASNSVTDFGLTGLEAYGYWTEPYTRARVVEPGERNSTTWRSPSGMFLEGRGYFSDVRTIEWISRGENFTTDDVVTVRIGRPEVSNGSRARVLGESYEGSTGRTTLDMAQLSGSELEDLIIERRPAEGLGYGQDGEIFGGTGYRFPPNVTVETPPERGNPSAIVSLSGVSIIRIQVLEGRQPDILSIARIHGNWYTVESVSEAKTPDDRDISGQYDVVFFPPVAYADLGFEINFHSVSYLSTGSHVMEYVGSGVTYNALPEYGGVPSEAAETRNIEPAKVFYTTSDHRGNSKVGPRFSVNQATGAITLDASSFDLQNLEGIGPFIRNGIAIGERLRELSNNVQLRSDATGQSDSQTAPTQVAVKTYVDRRAVPPVPNEYLTKKFFLQAIQDSQAVGDFQQQYGWAELDAGDLRIEEASLRADVLTGMFVDGDTRIYGNANVGTLLVSEPERDTPLPNGALGVSVDRSSGTPTLVFRFRGEDGDYTRIFEMNVDDAGSS